MISKNKIQKKRIKNTQMEEKQRKLCVHVNNSKEQNIIFIFAKDVNYF